MKITTLDLCIDIYDNYGDMGWMVEFLMMTNWDIEYRIFTDNPTALGKFFEQSGAILPCHTIHDISYYQYESGSEIIVLGLHARIDLARIPDGKHVLRVNYLSYDPWYRSIHLKEHIQSHRLRPIYEIVYSPLSDTGGVWHYPPAPVTRADWARKMGLSIHIDKPLWVPIFVYPETLPELDTEHIADDVLLLFIGTDMHIDGHITLPWLERDDFWELIELADVSLLRGEISSLRGYMSRKPFFWDMYKTKGGWNQDESAGYLEHIGADDGYRKVHDRINSGLSWNIDMLIEHAHSRETPQSEIPDFRITLEKTIDSFGFSL